MLSICFPVLSVCFPVFLCHLTTVFAWPSADGFAPFGFIAVPFGWRTPFGPLVVYVRTPWEIFVSTNHKHIRKHFLQFLTSQQGYNLWPHPLQFNAWKWRPCQGTGVFQQWNDSKRATTLIKAFSSLSNCHAKKECQLRWWQAKLIVGHKNFPQFARCFYDKSGVELLDLWFNDNVLSFLNPLSARNVCRKNVWALSLQTPYPGVTKHMLSWASGV